MTGLVACYVAECGLNWYLYDGHCVSPCPIKTYSVSDGVNSVCSRCHYTCETCSGPSEAECTSCQADATFVSSRCILQSVAWQIQFTKWHIVLTALLVIDLLALIAGAIYFIMRQKNASQHNYSSIAYSASGKKPVDEEKTVLWENESETEWTPVWFQLNQFFVHYCFSAIFYLLIFFSIVFIKILIKTCDTINVLFVELFLYTSSYQSTVDWRF